MQSLLDLNVTEDPLALIKWDAFVLRGSSTFASAPQAATIIETTSRVHVSGPFLDFPTASSPDLVSTVASFVADSGIDAPSIHGAVATHTGNLYAAVSEMPTAGHFPVSQDSGLDPLAVLFGDDLATVHDLPAKPEFVSLHQSSVVFMPSAGIVWADAFVFS